MKYSYYRIIDKIMLIQYSALIIIFLASCSKYLDKKPDVKLATPSTLQDLQALLDNTNTLNLTTPSLVEIAADNYYVTYQEWASNLIVEEKMNYIWDKDAQYANNWSFPYSAVYVANTVLDNLNKISFDNSTASSWGNLRGAALFFRAYSFFNAAQIYCNAYNASSSATDLGISLRMTSDINEPTRRASVKDTYERIISDLKDAISLLPIATAYPTRPSKTAAYAQLARVFLAMEDYTNAGKYADSTIQLYNSLIDYNTISTTSTTPFQKFNAEVIFHSISAAVSVLNTNRCIVDSVLYNSYVSNDLRKACFFQANGNGTYYFKGSYSAVLGGSFFSGLTTPEMFLIRAECKARQGGVSSAMDDLNTLLAKRWRTGTFIPLTAASSDDALSIILAERRKEDVFRGLRWSDLRRLNKDTRFARVLTRSFNTSSGVQVYTLPPNDLRYTLLIPSAVLSLTGIQQNAR